MRLQRLLQRAAFEGRDGRLVGVERAMVEYLGAKEELEGGELAGLLNQTMGSSSGSDIMLAIYSILGITTLSLQGSIRAGANAGG